MSRPSLQTGEWHAVANEAEFNNLRRGGDTSPKQTHHDARVQKGAYAGPGRYMLLDYSQDCPRGCCQDAVHEVLSAEEVATEVKEEIRELAGILREARRATKQAADANA